MVRKSIAALCGLAAVVTPLSAHADGLVFTLSNQTTGNSIITYVRHDDGALTYSNSYPTGGLGTGTGLGSEGAVSVNPDGAYVIAVNAGSNSISLFKKEGNDLQYLDMEPSGGVAPISVTQSGPFVYVLNGGDANTPNNIQEFFRYRGHLVEIGGGFSALSGPAVSPAQVSFSPDGDALVVTEKGSNSIDTFALDWFGRPTSASFNPSSGLTPYGFAFGRHNRLFVSEAVASALSSYEILPDLALKTESASVADGQQAACWAVAPKDGDDVYVINAHSGNVSGYGVSYPSGIIGLLQPTGVSGVTGGTPTEAAFDSQGKYLYVLTSAPGTIAEFKRDAGGNLHRIGTVTGLPASADGLAAE